MASGGGKRTVVVLGAAGKTAGNLVQCLKKDPNIQIRAAVRRQEAVQKLEAEGVRAVKFDFADYQSMVTAMRGADAVFLALPYTVDMLLWGKNAVDAAKEAGVRHVVKLTTFNQGRLIRNVGHFVWHELVDEYLKHSGLDWTLLAGHVFMQNCWHSIQGNEFRSFFSPNGRLGLIDVLDIARIASMALAYPQRHRNKHYFLSTEALTMNECAAIASEKLGRQIKYTQIPPDSIPSTEYGKTVEQAYLRCVVDFVKMADQGKLDPDLYTTTNTFHEVTGEQPCTFRDFLRRECYLVEASGTASSSGSIVSRVTEGIKSAVGASSSQSQATQRT